LKEKVMTDQAVSHSIDNAGVRVVPLFICIVVFGIGLALRWMAPLAFQPALPARVASLLLLGVGVVLIMWSNVLFRHAHTSMVPIRPSTALVITGPYRLTRNLVYLGLLCMNIGARSGLVCSGCSFSCR